MNTETYPKGIFFAAAALLLLAGPAFGQDGSNAANKTSAAGSSIEVISPALEETVLATTIKTSSPQDLIFAVTLECALWTTVQTEGNDDSVSRATVTITVLFDGVEVPISGESADGTVVFCDRTHQQTTTLFNDEDATIKSYLATRSANAFNWILPDVGSGVHTVQVVADLTAVADEDLVAKAAVGNRVLIVEPTQLAQGFTL